MSRKTLVLEPELTGLSDPLVLLVENIASLTIRDETMWGSCWGTRIGDVETRGWSASFGIDALHIGGGGRTEVGVVRVERPIPDPHEDAGLRQLIHQEARTQAHALLVTLKAEIDKALA